VIRCYDVLATAGSQITRQPILIPTDELSVLEEDGMYSLRTSPVGTVMVVGEGVVWMMASTPNVTSSVSSNYS